MLNAIAVTFLVMLVFGLGFMVIAQVNRIESLKRDLDKERYDHSVTRERILASHKDGWVIPPPPSPVEPEEDTSLPEELTPIWEQWEGPGAEAQKRVLRSMIASGRTVGSILEEFNGPPPPVE